MGWRDLLGHLKTINYGNTVRMSCAGDTNQTVKLLTLRS